MDALLRILALAVAFSALMSASSIVIATLVRLVHYLRRERGRNVAEMLAAFNHGYRRRAGDRTAPGDAESTAFAMAVLSDPSLHSPSELQKLAARNGSVEAQAARLKRRLERVDWVPIAAVLRIIRAHSPSDVLPNGWHVALPAPAARASEFMRYIEQEHDLFEGVSSERFRTRTKRLVTALSLLFVLVVHLDSFDLVVRMYESHELSRMVAIAPDLLAVAEREQPLHAELPVDDEALLVEPPWAQLFSLLNQPELGIGWQNSWYVRAGCRRDPRCAEALGLTLLPSSARMGRVTELGRWLFGLGLSWLLLSLGAPFWADRLRSLLNLHNAVRRRTEPPRGHDPVAHATSEPRLRGSSSSE